jgi:aspartate/methionine/tyrosine aminotransferase
VKTRPDLDALVQRHRLLDNAVLANRAQFISDWNCDNPLVEQLLGPQLASLLRDDFSRESYIYFDAEESLLNAICSFHREVESLVLSRSNVVAGPGSSSFLAAFALWLRRSGYNEVYYIPPLYHTLYFLLESLDINLTPVATLHAYEAEFSLRLPTQHTVLLMCDPVWYAGKCVPPAQIEAIAEWQRVTKSLVFVDGSFQYMKWRREPSEATAILDPELTFRLICPAKTLAVPFFRFAYLLHPSTTHSDFVFLYESLVGGANASDLAFAHRALQVLSRNGKLARMLPEYLASVFAELLRLEVIKTAVLPECGYFVFAVPLVTPANLVTMDQSYFELTGYPDYCRINLMAARRIYGLDNLEWALS